MNIAQRFCAHFLLAALAAGILASLDARAATCDLEPTFQRLQDNAIVNSAMQLNVRFEVGGFDTKKLNGTSNARENIVRLNPNLCDQPPIFRIYVTAHELGHLIADRLHPELTARVGLKTVPALTQETMADMYGSRLLTAAEHEELLAYFDGMCVADRPTGNQYGCERAERWRWAKTR